MYLHLVNQHTPFQQKFIWKLKISLKIKIFFWYLQRGVILIKDNLASKNWKGSQKWCFCNTIETIKHLFFDCLHHYQKYCYRMCPIRSGSSWITAKTLSIVVHIALPILIIGGRIIRSDSSCWTAADNTLNYQ
jgi:hypothetical protein